MKTEYTDFNAATAALHAEMAKGTHTVTMRTYQRPSDMQFVWEVTSVPTPTPNA